MCRCSGSRQTVEQAFDGVFLTLLWAVTSQGYYWPGWVLFGLAFPLGIHAIIVLAGRRGHPAASTARASA